MSVIGDLEVMELAIMDIGGMICGIETSYVQEINKHIELTKVSSAPSYIRGVLNLRGQIVTVIDLRMKFNLERVELNDTMRIVIVSAGGENIGLLIDSIDDIVIAEKENIEPPPANMNGIKDSYFSGIYKSEKYLVTILDIEEIIK